MELLFPDVASRLDWTVEPVFMDKELQKLTNQSQDSRRYVDKLVKVCGTNGETRWILLHIEVQGQPEADFTRRMFTYYYRLTERFSEPVVSMAILTDTRKNFRPDHYQQELLGCKIRFEFVMVKLLDWQDCIDGLLASDNIFGLLVAAQLIAKLEKNKRRRTDAVLDFYRLARKRQHSWQHIMMMLDFIEWMIRIPKQELDYYNEQVDRIDQEDTTMGYMAIYRRESYAKGIEQGVAQGEGVGRRKSLHKLLQLKFCALDDAVLQRLEQASDAELELWLERVLFAESLEAVFAS
jgi:uncharacterized protein (UPF0335 family)